jgi:hypothetical protein
MDPNTAAPEGNGSSFCERTINAQHIIENIKVPPSKTKNAIVDTTPATIAGGDVAALPADAIPLADLEALERQLNLPRWSIPIFSGQALDILLNAYQRLCTAGRFDDPVLLRFQNNSLLTTFEKITVSSAVPGWTPEVLVRSRVSFLVSSSSLCEHHFRLFSRQELGQ